MKRWFFPTVVALLAFSGRDLSTNCRRAILLLCLWLAAGSLLAASPTNRPASIAEMLAPDPNDPLTHWRDCTPTNAPCLEKIIFAQDQFVATAMGAGGRTNHIWTSPDGVAWTPHPSDSTNFLFNGIAYGNGIFVAVAADHAGADYRTSTYNNTIVVSTNGSHWSRLPLLVDPRTKASATELGDVAFGNGRFLILGNEPLLPNGWGRRLVIWMSVDGRNWTAFRTDTQWPNFNLTFTKDRFLSVSMGGVLTIDDPLRWMLTKTNGWHVSEFKTEVKNGIDNAVAYGNGTFVAVSDTSSFIESSAAILFASNDATNWITHKFAVSGDFKRDWHLQSVAFGGGWFVAVGPMGTILVSRDGDKWHSRRFTALNLKAVAYGKGRFIIAGSGAGCKIWQSDPLPDEPKPPPAKR